jgi:hypothetical protein
MTLTTLKMKTLVWQKSVINKVKRHVTEGTKCLQATLTDKKLLETNKKNEQFREQKTE